MMKKSKIGFCLVIFFMNISAFAKELNAGPWKFFLKTTNAEIPFVIDFEYDKNRVLTGKLHNGQETILLKDITKNGKDYVIPFGAYELSLELTLQDEYNLSGALLRLNKNPVTRSPVYGIHGVKDRFKVSPEKPFIDLTGKWSMILQDEDENKTPGIGKFQQKEIGRAHV